MRMWRSGNASPCRGEVPGPIPGIRSMREWRNWQPRRSQEPVSSDVRVRLPPCAPWLRDRVVKVPARKAGYAGSNPAGVSMEGWPSGNGTGLLNRGWG
jgi:hypothetical protein